MLSRRTLVWASLGKSKTLLKNNQSKRTGCMAQMIERLPSQHDALSLTPGQAKKKASYKVLVSNF
jgi:hypothetical protein